MTDSESTKNFLAVRMSKPISRARDSMFRPEEEYSSEYPTKGTIIRIVTADGNTITAGTTLKAGDTVIIYYSESQAPSEVPDVVGKDLSEALIALSQAGFNNVVPMPEENDSYPENEVISQDPPSGTVASVDDTITVFLCNGRADRVYSGCCRHEQKRSKRGT